MHKLHKYTKTIKDMWKYRMQIMTHTRNSWIDI